MKNLINLLLGVALIILFGCKQNKPTNAEEIEDNNQKEKEVVSFGPEDLIISEETKPH